MKNLLNLLFVFYFGVNSNSVQPILTSDSNGKYYVWARSGLNVKSGPGKNYTSIDGLQFGDSVEVILKTGVKFNIYAVSVVDTNYYRSENEITNPLILYGEWIQIKTEKGTIGFVASQYILRSKPNLEKEEDDWVLIDLKVESIDSSFAKEELERESILEKMVYRYEENIVQTVTSGGVWWDMEVEFEGYTKQEVLVIMDVDKETNLVIRNWKEEIELIDMDQICTIRIIQKGDKITFTETCSC